MKVIHDDWSYLIELKVVSIQKNKCFRDYWTLLQVQCIFKHLTLVHSFERKNFFQFSCQMWIESLVIEDGNLMWFQYFCGEK